jgi:hypothetical protein
MAKKIYKWEIDPPTTGAHRSFDERAWPMAVDIEHDAPIARIRCEESYVPSLVKQGKHSPLKLSIADYSEASAKNGSFVWKTLKKEFATLDEAKAALDIVLAQTPQILKRNNLTQALNSNQETTETSSSPSL